MLEQHEIDKFIEEISSDSMASVSPNQSQFFMQDAIIKQENEKLQKDNEKMRKYTFDLLRTAREVLDNNRSCSEKVTKLEKELLDRQNELEKLKSNYTALEVKYTDESNRSINQIFQLEQTVNQLKNDQNAEHEDYKILSVEYLSLLSDVTCFFNYDVKKHQNKIISKTEKFLYDCSKGEYKRPKIARRRVFSQDDDTMSVLSSVSSRSKRRLKSKTNSSSSKKARTDVSEFQSISQVASPASVSYFDEDSSCFSLTYTDSGISLNETLSPISKSPTTPHHQCRCHEEILPTLVSVGTNTESSEELPSLPLISDFIDDTAMDAMGQQIESCLDFNSEEDIVSLEDVDILNEANRIEGKFQTISNDSPKVNNNKISKLDFNDENEHNTQDVIEKQLSSIPIVIMVDSSTSTDPHPGLEFFEKRSMIDGSTSTVPPGTADKSINTFKSTTTRGTATTKLVTKNFAMQFPDINVSSIFEEFAFDLPDMLNPIEDLEDDFEIAEPTSPNITTNTVGTVTDLMNVNREIDYLCNQPLKIKIEKSSFDERKIDMNGEALFQLGKTVFELLLQRAKQKYGNDEDRIPKDDVWNMVNSRLIEKESTIDISFTDSEKSSEDNFENCQASELFGDFSLTKGYEEQITVPIVSENGRECYRTEIEIEEIPDITESESIIEFAESDVDMTNKDYQQPNENGSALNEVMDESEQQQNLECENLDKDTTANNIDKEFEDILKDLKSVLRPLPDLLLQIDDLSDTIWNEIFPSKISSETGDDVFDSPMSPPNILEDYDFENDVLEIPMNMEIQYTENDTPKSPEPFVNHQFQNPIEIPADFQIPTTKNDFNCIMKYDNEKRSKLLNWQTKHSSLSRESKKVISEMEKSIETYIEAEWTSENTEECLRVLTQQQHVLVSKTIYNIVVKFQHDREICIEFTPPAPPLPRYLQKLVLLIQKLSEKHPSLPKQLIEELEENIFKCQNIRDKKFECEDLRNFAYYYSSLVDLFYDGNTSMVFYFIVKSIYYFEQKAIPMIFVLIKAFPHCLVKKSLLLQKTSPQIDWENMSGLEVSRVQLNNEVVDSLDLTVMFILTYPQIYAKFNNIQNHELFNYLPKFYGFYSGHMSPQKLMSILLKRLEDGRFENLSLSFILFAKIMPPMYTVETLIKSNLYPFLSKLSQLEHLDPTQVSQACILMEAITSILKCYAKEKEGSIKIIITKVIEIYGRYNQHSKIRETCMKSVLRLQKFCGNHKEIYSMLKQHVEGNKNCMSENLYSTIETFIYRRRRNYFLD